MVDNMAQRYGVLPTQLLEHATTHDIQIYLHSITYESRQRADKDNVASTFGENEIQEIYKSWRGNSQ